MGWIPEEVPGYELRQRCFCQLLLLDLVSFVLNLVTTIEFYDNACGSPVEVFEIIFTCWHFKCMVIMCGNVRLEPLCHRRTIPCGKTTRWIVSLTQVLYVALCISCVVLLWNDGLCFHDTPFVASVLLYNITFFPLATLYIQRYHKFLIRMEIEEFNCPVVLFIAESSEVTHLMGNQKAFPFKASWYMDWQFHDEWERYNADPDIIAVCCDVLDTETISRFEHGTLDNWILRTPLDKNYQGLSERSGLLEEPLAHPRPSLKKNVIFCLLRVEYGKMLEGQRKVLKKFCEDMEAEYLYSILCEFSDIGSETVIHENDARAVCKNFGCRFAAMNSYADLDPFLEECEAIVGDPYNWCRDTTSRFTMSQWY